MDRSSPDSYSDVDGQASTSEACTPGRTRMSAWHPSSGYPPWIGTHKVLALPGHGSTAATAPLERRGRTWAPSPLEWAPRPPRIAPCWRSPDAVTRKPSQRPPRGRIVARVLGRTVSWWALKANSRDEPSAREGPGRGLLRAAEALARVDLGERRTPAGWRRVEQLRSADVSRCSEQGTSIAGGVPSAIASQHPEVRGGVPHDSAALPPGVRRAKDRYRSTAANA